MSIKPDTFHILTLGCAKNLVDSSTMSQLLNQQGYKQLESANKANFIIVNTCGFIHDARTESITELTRLAARKKPGQFLIAAGCLSQRQQRELLNEVDGIDGLMGTRNLADILYVANQLKSVPKLSPLTQLPPYPALVHANNAHASVVQGGSSYLKIADGCRRSCAFCAIPLIKGPLVSRQPAEIIADALELQAHGVKEINLIAQDVTDYGRDSQPGTDLASLLKQLLPQIQDIPWVRLLYTFPGFQRGPLMELMAGENNLLPYLDIPLQHASPAVLKSMSRPSDIAWVEDTLMSMRERIPGLVVRTTMIVGFPTETDTAFQQLMDFVARMEFDHLGVFPFSPENGTPAEPLGDPIPQAEKEARQAELMRLQAKISLRKNQGLIGRQLDMLVEGTAPEQGVIVGRTWRDAPEIDGLVIARGSADVGEMVPVRVTGALEHDLYAEALG